MLCDLVLNHAFPVPEGRTASDKVSDNPAPRGALLYPRLSREEFGGYSWV